MAKPNELIKGTSCLKPLDQLGQHALWIMPKKFVQAPNELKP